MAQECVFSHACAASQLRAVPSATAAAAFPSTPLFLLSSRLHASNWNAAGERHVVRKRRPPPSTGRSGAASVGLLRCAWQDDPRGETRLILFARKVSRVADDFLTRDRADVFTHNQKCACTRVYTHVHKRLGGFRARTCGSKMCNLL